MKLRWGCFFYRAALVDQADGLLPEYRKVWLEGHLMGCEDCAADLLALRTFPQRLKAAGTIDLGDEFWSSQRQAIARAIRSSPPPGASVPWHLEVDWRRLAAAALSLTLTIGVYRYVQPSPEDIVTPGASTPDAQSLDGPTLDGLRDIMAVFVAPADSWMHPTADARGIGFGENGGESLGANRFDDSPLHHWNDEELDGLADLVGRT